MSFEGDQYSIGSTTSPGGFEFGVQGWSPGQPIPKSITFFLDGSAMVCDQYGRPIRCSALGDRVIQFADRPPDANHDGIVTPRPQFATHAQVISALAEEGMNWLSYQVRWVPKSGGQKFKRGLTLEAATKAQRTLMEDGNAHVTIAREIVCAGWPQLAYDELKLLPTSALPPVSMERSSYLSYLENLSKISNSALRKDALRHYKELYEAGIRDTTMTEVG